MVDFKCCWCGGLGGGCSGLGEFRICLSGTGAGQIRGSSPGGRGSGQIVVLEGEWEDYLTVRQLFCGHPWFFLKWVCSRFYRAHWMFTITLHPLGGGGLAACVSAVRGGTASRAGLIGRSTLTPVWYDALNGQKVWATILSRMACWSGPLGSLQGAATGSGRHFNFLLRLGDMR